MIQLKDALIVNANTSEGISASGTTPITYADTVWEDNQVSVGRVRLGASTPAWRTYDHGIGGGVVFDVLGFDVGEYINFDIQTFHEMKLNTTLDCHLHFILPNTTNIGDKIQFQLDVIGAGIATAYAVPAGSPYTCEHTIVAGDDSNHLLLEVADIPAINTTVSTVYSCKLTRIAASSNEYGSEFYLKYIDGHYQKDTAGSSEEDSK